MGDLHYLSATEALAMFASRELSPVELMTAVGRDDDGAIDGLRPAL